MREHPFRRARPGAKARAIQYITYDEICIDIVVCKILTTTGTGLFFFEKLGIIELM